MDKLIMTFHVSIDKTRCSEVQGPWGGAFFLPFTAEVASDLFTGTTLPGAADIQTENHAHVRHMHAQYLFAGVDGEGKPCKLFVDNNGYMNPANRNDPFFEAQPRFLTDSETLGRYLCQDRFRSEVHGTEAGVDILVFDVLAEEETNKADG